MQIGCCLQDYSWSSIKSSSLAGHDKDTASDNATNTYHGQVPRAKCPLESQITGSSLGIMPITSHFGRDDVELFKNTPPQAMALVNCKKMNNCVTAASLSSYEEHRKEAALRPRQTDTVCRGFFST
jgi:hypothetical protein